MGKSADPDDGEEEEPKDREPIVGVRTLAVTSLCPIQGKRGSVTSNVTPTPPEKKS